MNYQGGIEGINRLQVRSESAIVASNPMAVLSFVRVDVAGLILFT